jgi:uncharacterized membrane protein YphA (DoxX/SURF4 family)
VSLPAADPVAGRPGRDRDAVRLWVSTVARLVLAGVLLAAGGLKVVDPLGSVRAVAAYQLLPGWLVEPVGHALPFLEIGLGLLLLAGFAVRLAAAVTAVLMIVFMAAVASAWARGLAIDCGCFGGGGAVAPDRTQYLQEILRDLGFLALAGWLVLFPHSHGALDRPTSRHAHAAEPDPAGDHGPGADTGQQAGRQVGQAEGGGRARP